MNIYPAIDILDGNAVRLKYGDYSKVTVYGKPFEMLRKWEDSGAKFAHIVDLNGARSDHENNAKIIEQLAKSTKLSIQVGGGIRSISDIIRCFDCGIDRVILGSACVSNQDFIKEAIALYGENRIICGADAKNGYISTEGWTASTNITLTELCKQLKSLGVTTVICTDISKDGALCGTNTENITAIRNITNMNVIASGGISCIAGIEDVKNLGAYGAIIGRALYENKFSLEDALAAAKE